MKSYQLLIFLLLSLTSLQCNKDNISPGCDSVKEAPDAFLEYFWFPKDSWWVYQLKNSSPAEYDTIRCTRSVKDFHIPGASHGMDPCVYFYENYFTHSNQTHFYGTGGDDKGGEYVYARIVPGTNSWRANWSTDAGNIPSPSTLFFYPFQVGESVGNPGVVIARQDTLVTPMGAFPGTVTVLTQGFSATDSITADYLRRAYFSPRVGLVRTDYTKNRVWELVNYHINL